MRISDWSSDVCSSDVCLARRRAGRRCRNGDGDRDQAARRTDRRDACALRRAAMREIGWAKINLALHVRARRPDGYHEIETLFAFVDGGDTIAAEIAEADTLTIDGEFAAGLSVGAENLVLRVLALLRDRPGARKSVVSGTQVAGRVAQG